MNSYYYKKRIEVTRICDKCGKEVEGRTMTRGPVTCPNCKSDRQRVYNQSHPKKLKVDNNNDKI